MSDQIILEFIGDPSGLKPAEEALKGLSKTSQETIEAFNKANDAAKKFAEAAKDVSASLKDVGDAGGKSIKAISSLTQAISGGAVKSIIGDFKAWATEITTLTTQKEQLLTKLNTVQTEMNKLKGELKNAAKEYNSLSKEAGTLESQITKTGNAIAFHGAAADKAAVKNETLKGKLSDVKKELAAMNGTSAEGSDKYQKLTAAAQKLEGQIEKNNKSYTDHAVKALDLGAKNEDLKSKLGAVTDKMITVSASIDTGKEKYAGLTKESRTLQGGIADTNIAIDNANQKFSEHSRAAEASTKSHKSLLDNTKILVSSMGEIGAAVAQSTGNEKEANAIRQKTAEVLNAISTAQGIATAATDGMTAATEIATAAATGLDVALWPITLVLLGIAATIAEVYAGFKLFQYVADTVKPIGDALKLVEDKARDLMSFLTFGLIDNAAVHHHKEDLKKIGDEHEHNSDLLKKQISLLETEGATSEKLAAKKKEQLEEEKKSLQVQIDLEDDIEKKKELQNKLDETALALIRNKKELTDAHVDSMKQEGATDLQILQYKQQQVAEEIKLNDVAIQTLKNQIRFYEIVHMGTDALRADLENLEALNAALTGKQLEQGKQMAQEQKKQAEDIKLKKHENNLKALEEEKTLAENQLAITKSNSAEELKAKLKILDIEQKIEIENAKENAELIESIQKKFKANKVAIEKNYNEEQKAGLLKQLNDEKAGIEAKLVVVKKGSADELTYKQDLFAKLRQLVNADIKLTENEKKKALNEIQKQEEDFAKEHVLRDADINNASLQDTIATNQEKLQDEKLTAQDRLDIQNDILVEKHSMDIASATATISDRVALDARLKEIDKQYIKDTKQLEDDARKDKEKKDQESGKKQKEMAKQIATALIEMAKQVSDAIFENEKQKRDNDLKEHLDNLNAQKDAELLNTTLTTKQRQAIEKKYKHEEAQEKTKAWKADQKAKAEQAIINGLLALTMSLAQQGYPAGLITGLLALASAGVQAGIILSKTPPKFAKGVVALHGPGTETSDSIAAYLSRGESVITAKATKQYAPILEAMNAGTYAGYMPIPQIPDVSRHQELTKAGIMNTTQKIDYEKLGEAFARKVNLKQLSVNIDEKGFTKTILSKGNRIESYNDKMKF